MSETKKEQQEDFSQGLDYSEEGFDNLTSGINPDLEAETKIAKNKRLKTWQEVIENKKEIYTTEKLFKICQDNEIPRLRPKFLKKQLIEHGMESDDINSAFELMACITGINKIIFDENEIPLTFVPEESYTVAGYCSLSKNPNESYQVFVKNCGKILEDRAGILLDEVGNQQNFSLTQKEILLRVAIHEVRHRLQYQKGFKFLSVENISDERNVLLKGYMNYFKNSLEIAKKLYRKKGETEEMIKEKINSLEFDSEVIANFAINEIRKGISLEDLIKIIQHQP